MRVYKIDLMDDIFSIYFKTNAPFKAEGYNYFIGRIDFKKSIKGMWEIENKKFYFDTFISSLTDERYNIDSFINHHYFLSDSFDKE